MKTDSIKTNLVKINFDESEILANLCDGWAKLESGTKKEGDTEILFTPILPDGKAVDHWLVSDKVFKPDLGNLLIYKVDPNDANKGVIDVKYQLKVAEKVKLVLEGNIAVWDEDYPKYYKDGDFVYHQRRLAFEATPSEGKMLEKWYMNDREFTNYNPTADVINADACPKNAEGVRVLKVRFTEKDAKFVQINFDESNINVFIMDDYRTNLESGKEIKEGTRIVFEPIRPEGKAVDYWLINDKKIEPISNGRLGYKVDPNDAKDDTIEVKCQLKDAEKVKLVLKDDIIVEGDDGKEYKNGDLVYDQRGFMFTANLSEGKALEMWYINGEKYDNNNPTLYKINADVCPKNTEGMRVLEVHFTEKDAKFVQINFDESKIWAHPRDNWMNLKSGTKKEEGAEIVFEPIPKGKAVNCWFVNDKKIEPNYFDGVGLFYKVNIDDAKDGVINVKYEL
ncbi:MAG: hypothetical protein P1P59_05090 [Treponemataceae bacterium]